MAEIQTGPPILNPTLSLKGIDTLSIPDIQQIGDADFRKYVPTGIKVVIDTPLVKNSRDALFAINLDGFIPTYVLNNNLSIISNTYKNMFPVQANSHTLGFVHISQEQTMIPAQCLYYSHRFMSGSVGVGLRVTSNTAQSGNLIISQATAVMRQPYAASEAYDGLRFNNCGDNVTDFSMNNFVVADVSLNRQVSITTTRRDPLKITDLSKKISEFSAWFRTPTTLNNIYNGNVVLSQFTEDWLMVGLLGNLPNQNADQVTIDIFFDYSRVNFYVPIFPIIPCGPSDFAKQILQYSETFNGRTTRLKEDFVWLPG